MTRLMSFFRSTRLARIILIALGAFIAVSGWLPWVRSDVSTTPPPGWAVATGFDHPFSSLPFLVLCLVLFLNTWACTWGRRARIAAIRRGEFPGAATLLPPRGTQQAKSFLLAQGFRGEGPVLHRFPLALWGGWAFHVGLLVLILAVITQQALHDGGQFELAEGERLDLSAAGAGFGVVRGPLAPSTPPALDVALVHFDPLLHQHGFASDRASRLLLQPRGEAPVEAAVDRAEGVNIGPVVVYQAIPSGVTITLALEGGATRSIHLREQAPSRASEVVTAPGGSKVHFIVEAERPFLDPRGTGLVTVRAFTEAEAGAITLTPGQIFPFGATSARFVEVGRWAGFTWARNPGLPFVFLGFGVILFGALLLAFPSAVARLEESPEGSLAHVHGRGVELLLHRWEHPESLSAPTR